MYDQESRDVNFSEKLTGNKRRLLMILFIFQCCMQIVVRTIKYEDTS